MRLTGSRAIAISSLPSIHGEKGSSVRSQPRHGRSDMTVEKVAATATADDECVECGYEPELKRTLGSFQIFAISFAFISVAVGIFATYDDVLLTAGPLGIWLWIIVGVGKTVVALVVAQFAAR